MAKGQKKAVFITVTLIVLCTIGSHCLVISFQCIVDSDVHLAYTFDVPNVSRGFAWTRH